jgi:sugar phosphate isomerase/epimerase
MNCAKAFASIVILLVVACSLAPASPAASDPGAKKGLESPFFAMDTATKDAKHQSAESQAAMVKELGYAGIGCDIGALPDMLKAVEAQGLKLFAVYVGASVAPNKPRYDARLKNVIESLKGRDTFIWLFITDGKPSATEHDARAVEIVQEVADMAAESGLGVALYPHTAFWMERVEDAVRVAKKAERKNVGVTFNLCHWLKVNKEENLKPLLKLALPHLVLVTINGADSAGKDWTTLIQTLDRGTFDIYGFMKTLKGLGYRGPVGFQGYGIKGDAHENLRRTIDAWRSMSRRLAAEKE